MKLPSKFDWALISISIAFISIFLIPWDKMNEINFRNHTSSTIPTKHKGYKAKTVPKTSSTPLDISSINQDILSKEIDIYQDNYEDYIQDPEDELRFPPEIFEMYSN